MWNEKDRTRTPEQMARKRAAAKEWERRNKEKRKASKAEMYAANKPKVLERNKEWQRKNPEKVKIISRRHYARHTEDERERNRKYRAANIHRLRAVNAAFAARRRALRAQDVAKINRACAAKRSAAPGRFTAEEISALYQKQRGRCAVCRTDLNNKFHRDHVMPIKLGGENTIKNIQLLCPPCNRQKQAKHPLDFMRERGYLL